MDGSMPRTSLSREALEGHSPDAPPGAHVRPLHLPLLAPVLFGQL